MTDTDLFTTSDSDVTVAPSVVVETTNAPTTGATRGGRGGSLTSMLLPDLRALAGEVGVKGTSGMRKSELISAIKEARAQAGGGDAPAVQPKATESAAATAAPATGDAPAQAERPRRERRSASRGTGAPSGGPQEAAQDGAAPQADNQPEAKAEAKGEPKQDAPARDTKDTKPREEAKSGGQDKQEKPDNAGDTSGDQQQGGQQNRNNSSNTNRDNNNRDNNRDNSGGDDDDSRQGRRGRRFRDRRRRGERTGGGEGGGGNETELREDDVVQPVAGILDVLDNYAFVRTSGYLAGPNDVYVSMNMVRKNGLRRGDAVTGAVRVPRDGDTGGNNPRQKFNPLVRLDTVNGGPVDAAKNRPEFGKLTPLYPNQRLRLETAPEKLTTRVIDLIMPIGKGQRALIVSPPKAGKTTIMQDIANAITRNNPECHLMVVLVDERPEEVTDMQRSVKGEVIASTFDRPPSDHTQAAELAIERAKRLVEQGKDVVVLLDSITRLGRAYNNASPASGRILSGGVDSTALYPPKRFLGAARNIEHGGSLTIIATAMVETGSTGDTVIFEEFKGTGNAELKLDRKIAERRVFPAVDVNPSGTRKDELLLGPDEFAIVHKLRRVLSGLDSHQAIDLLMSQLRKTKTNYEFLVQVSKTAPGSNGDD
ncbi:transcription termination factor Rho [Mycolicibacterium sp. J2]|uniref:transcription termination factor Rho n=1 Tax=Mycolicibacterium sp. J2 TaxID=2993511 RepID=UPI00224A9DAA|nr:transcription termination factor Rho [Mycolicibacterium sp. J2]MCX2714985.1 transcription termination factor Rho [Mycolicibacterium sp. J2]